MKKIYILMTVLCAFAVCSCNKDILDQKPTDQYTDAQVWSDETLINSHLAELYAMCTVMINDAVCIYSDSPLNVDFSRNANWSINLGYSAQGEGPILTTTIADEAKMSMRGSQTHLEPMKLYGLQTNSSYLRWWSNGYYLNRQLNNFIEQIGSSPVTNAAVRQAEARFLRAYNYFALVKRYGGIPLITKTTPINATGEEMYPKRKKEADIYDFIIKECLEIADILPSKVEAGRAGKWAALALASRAALYAGSIAQYGKVQYEGVLGIAADRAQSYYEICADACEKIKNESGHALYTGADKVNVLRDVFLVKNNTEAIMVKRHQGIGGQMTANLWSWDICMCPKPNAWSVGQNSLPYYDFVEQFDFVNGDSGAIDREYLQSRAWTMEEFLKDRDPRLRAWLWTNGSDWSGAIGAPVFKDNTISLYTGIKLPDGSIYSDIAVPSYQGVMCYGDQIAELKKASLYHTGFGVRKYLDPNADNSVWFNYSTTDYQIFRYAEVLLNYAEACFELNRPGDALDAVNQIRRRAGVAALTGVTRESIRKERFVELCFENHRYWDLRRWREAQDVLSQPHDGLNFYLDWNSYKKGGEPRFWLEIEDHIDSKVQDPTFPESNYYFPIGLETVAINQNLFENPGY